MRHTRPQQRLSCSRPTRSHRRRLDGRLHRSPRRQERLWHSRPQQRLSCSAPTRSPRRGHDGRLHRSPRRRERLWHSPCRCVRPPQTKSRAGIHTHGASPHDDCGATVASGRDDSEALDRRCRGQVPAVVFGHRAPVEDTTVGVALVDELDGEGRPPAQTA